MTCYDYVVDRKIGEVEVAKRATDWIFGDPCNCFFSNQACADFRECPPNDTYHTGTKTQSCWEVSGGVTMSVAAGILPSMFAKLGVSVNIGGKLNGCTDATEDITLTISHVNCWKHGKRVKWVDKSVKATWIHIDAFSTWHEDIPNWSRVCYTACGVTFESATVKALGGEVDYQLSVYPPCPGLVREGEVIVPPLPPGDDRAMSIPCCHPLPPCDPLPPGTPPCCGCQG